MEIQFFTIDKIKLPRAHIPNDKVTHHILSRSKMMEILFLRADAGAVKLYGWKEENNSGQIPLSIMVISLRTIYTN